MKITFSPAKLMFLFLVLCTGQTVHAREQIRHNQPAKHQADTTAILWTEEKGRIVLNNDFLNKVTPVQRAALGYIATQCGNDCSWDGPMATDQGNLKCRLLTALDLGYMCSSRHLSFLRSCFRHDKTSLRQLQQCLKKAADDPVTDKFTNIILITEGPLITIIYRARGRSLPEQRGWTWIKKTVFTPGKHNSIKLKEWENLDYRQYTITDSQPVPEGAFQ